MTTWATTIAGALVVVVSAGAITAAVSGRGRREIRRVAIGLSSGGIGFVGATMLGMSLAPTQLWILAVGLTLAGGCAASATVLGFMGHRDTRSARQRDAALGQPPIITAPPKMLIVCGTGFVAVLTSGVLIAPWMLVAAEAAGLAPGAIIPGLVGNTAMVTPALWVGLGLVIRRRTVRVAYEAQLLRRGVELRVSDAAADGYQTRLADHTYRVRYRAEEQ
jgi:hypothetical protein